MELVRALKQKVTKRATPDPRQIRALVPIKNEFVTAEAASEGGITLSAPLDTQLSGFFQAVSKRMKNLPSHKSFSLDPVGAFVWELCDGAHTVEKISKKLQDRYKMNRLEAETALTAYLQTLSTKKLITLQRGAPSKNR